jgi:hypothetical protein
MRRATVFMEIALSRVTVPYELAVECLRSIGFSSLDFIFAVKACILFLLLFNIDYLEK